MVTNEMVAAFMEANDTAAARGEMDAISVQAGLEAAVGDKLERLAALEAFMDEEAIQEALRVWGEAKEDEAAMFRPKH